MVLGVKKINSTVDLQYLEVSSLFFVLQSQFFHKLAKLFILRLTINKSNQKKIALLNSIVRIFFLPKLCHSTKNSTLNYAPIYLLSTKRLNHNLINSFVKKNKFLLKIYAKKKTLKTRKSKSTEKQNQAKETYF